MKSSSGLFLDQVLGFDLVLRWVPVSEDGGTFHRACIWMQVRYRVTLKWIFTLVMEWALSVPWVCFAFPSLCNSHLIRISAGLEDSLIPTTLPKSQLTWILCPFFHVKIENTWVNVFWFMVRIHYWYFKSHLVHELALLVFTFVSISGVWRQLFLPVVCFLPIRFQSSWSFMLFPETEE